MKLDPALLSPETWASAGDVALRETHISWVLLTADRAYKVKKPVTLPFLDYGTLALRRAACASEVRLNRRLAPDLYLGVRALVRTPGGGLRLAAEDAPDAVEYAVEMRRFGEDETLAARIGAGAVSAAELRDLGAWLAAFHATAPVRGDGGAEAVKRAFDDTLATLLGLGCPQPRLERWASALLAARHGELDARAARGQVRDGHGDLRAEHVLLRASGPAAVDCIEFSDALRAIDTGSDLSFLVMDLVRLGREDLAAALLAGYRGAGGDPGDDGLLAFHAAYRALVRAKVALLRARQLDARDQAAAAVARGDADTLVALAGRFAWWSRRPLVLAIAGLPASGKSTLAGALARASGFAWLDSDRVRKELAGISPEQRGTPELYDREHDDATYAELARRAGAAAGAGVIVEATFRRRRHRDLLASAVADAGARLLVVECRAPEALLIERAQARSAEGRDVSDAGAEIVRRHLGEWEPFDDLAAAAHLALRTDCDAEDLAQAVADALDRRCHP